MLTRSVKATAWNNERTALAVVRPVLIDIEQGCACTATSPLTTLRTHLDHFIAWSRYPTDFGHNFVLANNRCNSQKCERLPAYDHLAAWTDRTRQFGDQIGSALKERGIIGELIASNCVAQWAYEQTESANGLTWLRSDELEPLNPQWRALFAYQSAANDLPLLSYIGCSRATTLRIRVRKALYMEIIRLHTCKQCGKTWFPRTPLIPRICPTCKTTYWIRRRRKEFQPSNENRQAPFLNL
jgi:hypothetical protein